MHKVGAHVHAFCTPRCGGQHAADTYREAIMDAGCRQQNVSDNCYQFTTPTLFMYSRWGIPRDSLKPHDITQSMQFLFT